MKTIIKRDDTTETFDINKIAKVLKIAFDNTNVINPDINSLLDYINKELEKKNTDNYKIEEIQDLVENSLMIFKYYETAKHYINYRNDKMKLVIIQVI